MMKNFLPFCGIELPTKKLTAKAVKIFRKLTLPGVRVQKRKKEVIIRIIYSFVGVVTVHAYLFFMLI